MDYQKVGDTIRIRRTILGYNQTEAAEKADISQNHYARIERGEIKGSLETYFKIATALGISIDAILQELYSPDSDAFISAVTMEMRALNPNQRKLVYAFIKTLKEYKELQF